MASREMELAAAALAGAGIGYFLAKRAAPAPAAPASEKPKAGAKGGGGRFAGINRPYGGARSQKSLPAGAAPLQLYSLGTPNGIKVTVCLEEMKLDYDAHTIKIMEKDQFTSGFTDINPNQKIPALVDNDGPDGQRVRVFESGAMLLYLAQKTGKFIPPKGSPELVECLNWLFFQMGSGPYIGQFGHFYKYAPEKIQYAIDRYTMETCRLLDVLDKELSENEFLGGDQYSIADMAWWPWVRCIDVGYKAKDFLYHEAFPGGTGYRNVERWSRQIEARPAVQRGLKVNHFSESSAIGPNKGPELLTDEGFATA